NIVWNVRLTLGDMPPWRYGPFDTKKAAQEAFSTIIAFVDRELELLVCDAGIELAVIRMRSIDLFTLPLRKGPSEMRRGKGFPGIDWAVLPAPACPNTSASHFFFPATSRSTPCL